jgi:hypothetical protein
MAKPSDRIKAFFANLKHTRLLCRECGGVKKVARYVGKGMVVLECQHERHV